MRTNRIGWLGSMAVSLAVMLVAPHLASAQAKPEQDTMAKQAGKIYHEGLSQWRLKNYQQAGDLFSQMIKRYPGNEDAPDAQLYLANCLAGQKKDVEYLQQLDTVIRTYSGTEISLLATMMKLGYQLGKNDSAGFFTTWKEAIGGGGAMAAPHYLLVPGDYTYYFTNCAGLRQHFSRDFRDDIIKLCNKPELAEQALLVFAGTFRQPPDKLSPRWFWVHVYLLLAANKAAEAEAAFTKYTEWWGDDHRGAELWWEYAEYMRTKAKKPDQARKLYDTILQKYAGIDTAADAGARIADMLRDDDAKVKEFFEFAEPFVQRYRFSDGAKNIQGMMLKKAVELAPKDPAMAERAFKMLTENIDRMPAMQRVGQYEALIRLAMSVKQNDKAKGYFTELIGDDMWSSYAYGKALAIANVYPEFKPLVEAGKRRRQIYDPPPAAKPAAGQPASAPEADPETRQAVEAAAKLEQLRTRMKDDQMRFAEEIAEEMFTKFTDTAATIEAVSMMIDYYFKQEMVEPRDKWMERAINTWQYHPKAEEALNKRCVSHKAASEYDKLTRDVEAAMKRFPSSQYRQSWGQYRQLCYETAKDNVGRYEWIRKELDWTASNGYSYHIQLIVAATPVETGQDRSDVIAQAYLAWAKRFGESNMSVWCTARAYETYESAKLYDKAKAICTTLRTQKINPALAWRYQFNDIELMLLQDQFAEAVAAATQRLPGEPRPQFRVYRQLNMGQLGRAFGKTNKLADAKTLSDKLAKLYVFPDDIDTAELLLANALLGTEDAKDAARAADIMFKVAKGMSPTDLGYGLFMQAAYHARATQRYEMIVNSAIKAMPRAQHLIPKMLGALGQFYIGQQNKAIFQIQTQLRSTYPASDARDKLDEAIDKARARAKGN